MVKSSENAKWAVVMSNGTMPITARRKRSPLSATFDQMPNRRQGGLHSTVCASHAKR